MKLGIPYGCLPIAGNRLTTSKQLVYLWITRRAEHTGGRRGWTLVSWHPFFFLLHWEQCLFTNDTEATGFSLIELARAACDLDGEQIEALNVAAEYLAIAKTSHCLGHAVLRSSCERLSKKPSLESSRPSCPEDCSHLVELLQLLVCVHQLCSTPLGEQNPLPWAPQSRFRELQDELEDYLLRHPNTFRFGGGPPLYHSPKSNFDGSIMASLVWHCGVIILNRTFLPIPERPPPTGEVAVVRCIEFPQAPPLFLKERVYRCVSSSDAICEITRDVIKGGGFYSVSQLLPLVESDQTRRLDE